MDVRVGLWRKLSAKELMLLNCGVGENSWESLGLQGDPTGPSKRRSFLGVYWKDRCWSWNSKTLATWWEELTHQKRPWVWERLRGGGDGDDRGWDGWMASPTRWTWVWVNSGSCWWSGRPGVLRFMESHRVGHDWATELNWTAQVAGREEDCSTGKLSSVVFGGLRVLRISGLFSTILCSKINLVSVCHELTQIVVLWLFKAQHLPSIIRPSPAFPFNKIKQSGPLFIFLKALSWDTH